MIGRDGISLSRIRTRGMIMDPLFVQSQLSLDCLQIFEERVM